MEEGNFYIGCNEGRKEKGKEGREDRKEREDMMRGRKERILVDVMKKLRQEEKL